MNAVSKSELPYAAPCTDIEQLSCPTGLLTGEIFSWVDVFCEHNVDRLRDSFGFGFLLHLLVYQPKFLDRVQECSVVIVRYCF